MDIWGKIKSIFRSRKASVEFQAEWVEYLEQSLPMYSLIPDDLKLKVHGKISQFIGSTYFKACNGLELTDEMIVSVAGQACMLIVNHDGEPYPNLKRVYLYPTTFKSVQQQRDSMGIVTQGEVSRLGESWGNGTVILAWDAVKHGARNMFDGQNVTFHEFAHQLDQENTVGSGLPYLHEEQAFAVWASVLSEKYEQLLNRVERGKKTVMDQYGATNMAEFFAVATETFFEKPKQMKKKHPKLYRELKGYYKLNPIEWEQR